jgi:Mrp family chromosome partitioning ATPase
MRTETNEGYGRVALFLAEAARQGEIRSVFFASATSGEGTTTAVLQVARQLRETFGIKPLVIEWRRARPKLAAMLGLKAEGTLERCLADALPLKDCVHRTDSGLTVLPAASAGAAVSLSGSADALRRVLEDAHKEFDVVLVDAPPVLEDSEAFVLARVIPQMVLVIRAGNTSEQSIERVQQQMAAENVKIVGAILNRYRRFIPGWISRWLTR